MSESEIILYTSEDGTVNIHVNLEDETVWLTQEQIANLFGKARNTITEHIKNIFSEGELDEKVVCREIRHTTKHGAIEGKFQRVTSKYYNLDVIISVGYRVKSVQGTRFRQWATKRIHEYIVKGFTIDDNRLKQEGGRSRYFEELLQRVRDIRSSERNFYEKIKAIYATSIDGFN
ncbi:MAG: virulence RhuM family protein [Ignavibacteriaceae bacterium]|nr:virulence RhuM family protein [Ignavibacteriaceae bacterium]